MLLTLYQWSIPYNLRHGQIHKKLAATSWGNQHHFPSTASVRCNRHWRTLDSSCSHFPKSRTGIKGQGPPHTCKCAILQPSSPSCSCCSRRPPHRQSASHGTSHGPTTVISWSQTYQSMGDRAPPLRLTIAQGVLDSRRLETLIKESQASLGPVVVENGGRFAGLPQPGRKPRRASASRRTGHDDQV